LCRSHKDEHLAVRTARGDQFPSVVTQIIEKLLKSLWSGLRNPRVDHPVFEFHCVRLHPGYAAAAHKSAKRCSFEDPLLFPDVLGQRGTDVVLRYDKSSSGPITVLSGIRYSFLRIKHKEPRSPLFAGDAARFPRIEP
jgi:hypothetical protein